MTPVSRTDWAEEQIAKLCSFPLTAETVFLRVKYERSGPKEVCDVLLALRAEAVVLSLKHQEDPDSRTGDRLVQWCSKAAEGAARQLVGAVKTIETRSFWCDHAKRGRVDFQPGVLQVRHAIAVVESGEAIELPDALPDNARGVPVTYMTSSDLGNVIKELHSFPDIVGYLDARLKLPLDVRRTIGLEESLYSYYVLNDQSFNGCGDFEDVIARLDTDGVELTRRIVEKHKADTFASIIESVSYSLDVPPRDAATWGATAVVPRYAEAFNRIDYTKAQEYLCDLRLGERRAIGEKFLELRSKVEKGLGFSSMHSDGGDQDFLLVVAVAKGLDRPTLFAAAERLLVEGLAYYRKTVGMIIVEREGPAYITMLREGRIDSPDAVAAGEQRFGRLKTTHTPIQLLPEEGQTTDP
jgi:hypothetical protein